MKHVQVKVKFIKIYRTNFQALSVIHKFFGYFSEVKLINILRILIEFLRYNNKLTFFE